MLFLVLSSSLALAGAPDPLPVASASALVVSATGDVDAILTSSEPFEQRVAALVELGPGAGPELFARICARAEEQPPSAELELLRAALARLDREAVRTLLDEAARDPDAARRLGVIAVSAALESEGLALAITAASFAPENAAPEQRVVEALTHAAEEQLRASPARLDDLPWLAREAPNEVRGALVRAAAEVGGEAALESLVRMLGHDPAVDATVLSHLGRAGRDVLPPLSPACTSPILSALSSMDENVVRCALQAAGQLELVPALESCIGLLDSPSEQIALESHRALSRITGLEFSASPSRWLGWFRQDRAWFDHQAEGVFATLASGAPLDRRRAVDELLQHRLDRHRLATELTTLLEYGHPDLRLLAVQALRRLQSRAAVPALVLTLSDPSPEVAQLAHETLMELTGRDHAPEAAAWLEVLGPE